MTADEYLKDGDLNGARAELVGILKRSPEDQRARMFLFQLLCICGEWDKATTQLRALASLSPEAEMLAAAYNPLIEAEKARAAAFSGAAAVPILIATSDWVEVLARSITAGAQGRTDEADALRDQAFDAAPSIPGEFNGRRFGWIADADSRFGPSLELIVGGRWGLVPFEALTELTSEGVQDLRDLIWLPVELTMRSGQSASGFLPARYPGSEAAGAQARLAKVTEWAEGGAGLGQRLWTFDDGEDVGVLSLRQLQLL